MTREVFPLNRWWVAGFSWELADKPLARSFLNRPMVLFRTPDGAVAALEDRCCHKELPLSMGAVEQRGLRCGYHGLLFNHAGGCIEVPGQPTVPARARVRAYPLREQDQILWVWIGAAPDQAPPDEPPLVLPCPPGSWTECVASNTTGHPVSRMIASERMSETRLL